MIDLRKIAIVFVIALLFALLINAVIGAFYVQPKYEDYCKQEFFPQKQFSNPVTPGECTPYDEPTTEMLNSCAQDRGYPEYDYDSKGCITAYTGCNVCQREYDVAREKYNLSYFIFSSILAVLGIALALLLPTKLPLNEWIATGFMVGGLLALLFGTLVFYQYLGRYLKPAVLLVELALIIYLSYKKLSPEEAKPKG